MKFEFFKRKSKEEEWKRKNQEAIEELNNPELEKLSEEFFKLSTYASGLGALEGGESGPFADEYRETLQKLEKMKEEKGDELFLYTTKKEALFKERGIFYSHRNHWRGHFLQPDYISRLSGQLENKEIAFLFREIVARFEENLGYINNERESREKHSELEPDWKIKYWVQDLELDRQNIEAILPVLSETERKKAEELLQESRSALDKSEEMFPGRLK